MCAANEINHSIGTGLFIGSGSILSMGGPLALFLGYVCMMAVVWNIMNNLAEIVVYLPLKGATIPYFVDRFVEPSLAFASGWNYWYAYAILVAGTCLDISRLRIGRDLAGSVILRWRFGSIWSSAIFATNTRPNHLKHADHFLLQLRLPPGPSFWTTGKPPFLALFGLPSSSASTLP